MIATQHYQAVVTKMLLVMTLYWRTKLRYIKYLKS